MNINHLIRHLAEKFAEEHLHEMQDRYKDSDGHDLTEAEVVIQLGEEDLDTDLDNLVVAELRRLAENKYAELCKDAYGKVQYHKYGINK